MSVEEPKGKRKRRTRAEIAKEISENYAQSSFNVGNIQNNMVLPVCASELVNKASSQAMRSLCEDVSGNTSELVNSSASCYRSNELTQKLNLDVLYRVEQV